MDEISKMTSNWRKGDRIDFDNGGSVIVHWIDETWIGFSTDHPDWDGDPILRKMTPTEFEASLSITRDKIARSAETHG